MSSASGSSSKVDCSRAGQSVWLVKVPKYLADVWAKADGSGIVGSLRIPHSSASKSVIFKLSDNLTNVGGFKGVETPQEHKMIMSDVKKVMGIFSEAVPEDEDAVADFSGSERIAFEGKITKRADCCPVENPNYMLMKRKAFEKACIPARQAKQITEIHNVFKPVSDHAMNLEPEKRRKEEGKRVRAEREEVMDMLFSAFERHQYYSLKDLVHITQQPVVHLKNVLRDICNYNVKNPHKNMYELKPEYRHYGKSGEKAND